MTYSHQKVFLAIKFKKKQKKNAV